MSTKLTKAQRADLESIRENAWPRDTVRVSSSRRMLDKLEGYGWIEARMQPGRDAPYICGYRLTELGENALAGRSPT